jgi:hypothetical protein
MKIHTFIFVHSQKIILDFIRVNKFKDIENVKYVFVGNGDTSFIESLDNVIICKDLPINIEQYPKLVSFTGWYALWKNNLIGDADYINVFEYDVNLADDFINKLKKQIADIVGYIKYNVHDVGYVEANAWCEHIVNAIKKHYNIDVYSLVASLPKDAECSVTSNHTLSKERFEQYMNWVEPMIDDLKESNLAGHQIERSISMFYLVNGYSFKIILDILEHFNFDSHETQSCVDKDKKKYQYYRLLR